jgi:hypothetical protein
MIATSYFNKPHPVYGKMIDHPNAVSIANMNYGNPARECVDLMPGEIYNKYKAGIKADDPEAIRLFTIEYNEKLDKLDVAEIVAEVGQNAILLCHEKPPKFCHRHLVAKWFEDARGIEVSEL